MEGLYWHAKYVAQYNLGGWYIFGVFLTVKMIFIFICVIIRLSYKMSEIITTQTIVVNKGTGAGGANTNYYGRQFEEKTNNQQRLLDLGYIKNSFTKKPKKVYDYYLSKTFEDKTIVFVLQSGLKIYMQHKYNIDLFRCPDEAYIIEYNSGRKVIKIIEKKNRM
jgi:hypothetical protein